MTGHKGVTYLDEIGGDNDSVRQGGNIAPGVTSQLDQLLALNTKTLGVRRDIYQLNTALKAHRVQQKRKLEMMQANI